MVVAVVLVPVLVPDSALPSSPWHGTAFGKLEGSSRLFEPGLVPVLVLAWHSPPFFLPAVRWYGSPGAQNPPILPKGRYTLPYLGIPQRKGSPKRCYTHP